MRAKKGWRELPVLFSIPIWTAAFDSTVDQRKKKKKKKKKRIKRNINCFVSIGYCQYHCCDRSAGKYVKGRRRKKKKKKKKKNPNEGISIEKKTLPTKFKKKKKKHENNKKTTTPS